MYDNKSDLLQYKRFKKVLVSEHEKYDRVVHF